MQTNKYGINKILRFNSKITKMTRNLKLDNGLNSFLAQVVVPTIDVSGDIEFFKEKFGFKLQNIFPDDDPEVAILFGNGLHLRLKREKGQAHLDKLESIEGKSKPECEIFLLTDDKTILETCDKELITPGGGAMVRIEPKTFKVTDIKKLRDNIEYFDIEIECASQKQVSDPSSDVWAVGRAGMLYRNILSSRLDGMMSAEHIWIPKGGPVPDNVHFHTICFQLIYCLTGWVRLVYEDQGAPFVLNAGDFVTQPPEIRHRVLECSDNLQVIEIGVPSTHMTSLDHDMVLPTNTYNPQREWKGQKFCHFKAAEATWQADTGILECKDTRVYETTNGLVSVKIFRIRESAFDHHDKDCFSIDGHVVFTYLLKGSMKLAVAGKESFHLKKGNSYMIPGNKFYQFIDFSDDLELLQVALTGLGINNDKIQKY